MKVLSLPILLLFVLFSVCFCKYSLAINIYVSVHIFTFSCSLCFCGKHEPKHGILCDLSCVGTCGA